MVTRSAVAVVMSVCAFLVPTCIVPVRPVAAPSPGVSMDSLWVAPRDLRERDLFNGPWGADMAPRPTDVFVLEGVKHHGVNPGLTVKDSSGRKWSVKQPLPDGPGDEGPVEVVMSRILSAIGYRQPPVYYLPAFTLRDDWGVRPETGGRFRLSTKSLRDVGSWSWQHNPFVGTQPYQGLIAILLMLNSSDLKSANNTIYVHGTGDLSERWYVVRDLGAALGTTGRLAPRRNDAPAFERTRFTLGVDQGFVRFAYGGRHQELVRGRLTPEDVAWGARLLAQLGDRQWQDAFRTGEYSTATSARFIAKIQANIREGLSLTQTTEAGEGR